MIENIAVFTCALAGLVIASLFAKMLLRIGFPLTIGGHRYLAIDGLRGYLALCVAVSHFCIWWHAIFGAPLDASSLTRLEANLGKGAVAIFFMITAFLFYPRTLKGFGAVGWRYLLISRLFRLYPLFLFLMAASLVLLWSLAQNRTTGVLDGDFLHRIKDWLLFMGTPDLFGVAHSGLMTMHPTWSLYWEWLFYIALLPVTALFMSLKTDRIPSWTVPAAYLVVAVGARATLPAYQVQATYLAHFSCGMLVYEYCARNSQSFLARPAAGFAAVIILLAGLWGFSQPGIATLVFYVPLFACVASGNTLGGILRFRGALVLGEVSYGIYLAHQLVITASIFFLKATGMPSFWGMLLLLPLIMLAVVGLAALGFVGIEKPMINRGHALGRRYRRQNIVPTAVLPTPAG